jgi:SAM-dependent methyltransferase
VTQNIYDNDEFFAGYSGLRRSVEGLDGAQEWPAMRALLPDLKDARVIDLGCGFGWFCRWARDAGAAQVLGLDVSEKMLARARETTPGPVIQYERADLETLVLPPTSFDLAYSSLALHYVVNLDRLLQQIHCALVAGGTFVFSTEHPIYTAPTNPGWSNDEGGRRTWPIDNYQGEGARTTDWLAKGVVKQHRTIGTTLNALLAAGFTLTHVEEWGPTVEQIAAWPELAVERERPMFLLVAARK